MNQALATLLPELMPAAIAWAEQSAEDIAKTGFPLNEFGISLGKRVGVIHPERVRLKFVDTIPKPDDSSLRAAIELVGFLGPNTAGLTLGHSIYIRNGTDSIRLVSHELRHVYQYECAGSIALFLPLYLEQIVQYGYENAPYEVDARANEIEA
jgi:hypothetical protein